MQFVGIQYMRGLAALGVVYVHVATAILGHSWERTLSIGIGGAGVDVFFVISGFIIWQTTEKPDIRPMIWWRSRLIRIAPMYWLALLATLLIRYITDAPMPGFIEGLKAFLFIPVTNSTNGTMTPFLQPGWTLNYEFAFYGMMAIALNLNQKWLRAALLSAVLIGLVALRKVADPTDAVQFRMTSPLFLEFLSGIGIAAMTRSMTSERLRTIVGIAALVGATAFISLVSTRLFPDGPRFIYFGVPAALVVLAAVCLEHLIRRRVSQSLKYLGDSSYSLYLSHSLVFAPGLAMLYSLGLQGFLGGLLLVGLCIAVGAATYQYVERPLLRILNARIGNRQASMNTRTA